jgi:hypothetical protein
MSMAPWSRRQASGSSWSSPILNADMFQLFADAFAQAFPRSLNILLLDNSGAHTAARLTLPENANLAKITFLPVGNEANRTRCLPAHISPLKALVRHLVDIVI